MAEANVEYQYTTTERHPEPMKGYVEATPNYSSNQYCKTSQTFEQHETYQVFKQPEVVYPDHDIILSIRKVEKANDVRVVNMIERAIFAGLVVLGFICDYRFINWLLSLWR